MSYSRPKIHLMKTRKSQAARTAKASKPSRKRATSRSAGKQAPVEPPHRMEPEELATITVRRLALKWLELYWVENVKAYIDQEFKDKVKAIDDRYRQFTLEEQQEFCKIIYRKVRE